MYLFSVLNESFSLSASAMFNFHDLDDTIWILYPWCVDIYMYICNVSITLITQELLVYYVFYIGNLIKIWRDSGK